MRKFFEEPSVEVIKLQEAEQIMVTASDGYDEDES